MSIGRLLIQYNPTHHDATPTEYRTGLTRCSLDWFNGCQEGLNDVAGIDATWLVGCSSLLFVNATHAECKGWRVRGWNRMVKLRFPCILSGRTSDFALRAWKTFCVLSAILMCSTSFHLADSDFQGEGSGTHLFAVCKEGLSTAQGRAFSCQKDLMCCRT